MRVRGGYRVIAKTIEAYPGLLCEVCHSRSTIHVSRDVLAALLETRTLFRNKLRHKRKTRAAHINGWPTNHGVALVTVVRVKYIPDHHYCSTRSNFVVVTVFKKMPPHVHIDHHDDFQEASSPLSHKKCMFPNEINDAGGLNYEQSPLFQDDLSTLTSRTGGAARSPLDALRDEQQAPTHPPLPVKKPEVKRITGIEAIIGSESRYVQYEIAAANKNNYYSSSSTVATTSTSSTTTTSSTAAHGSGSGGGGNKKFSQKVNSALFPKDPLQRRKQIAGFFKKGGKKIVSSIVNKKKKSKKNP
jgi:hypothetical protein